MFSIPKRNIFVGVILLVAIICAVHLLMMGRHQAVVSPVLLFGGIENKASPSKFSRLMYKAADTSFVHSVIPPRRPRPKKKHRSRKAPVMVNVSSNLPTLPPDVIRGLNFFAFFIGYPRSGHSIVGSILDAHPHIVMSHELNFFEQWSFNEEDTPRAWAANLYNIIYQRSVENTLAGGLRNVDSKIKGYSLAIGSLWQGKFDKSVQVLGDKSGGSVTLEYMRNRIKFRTHYQEFVKKIGIPIKVLHVLRNPYDVIATRLLYMVGRQSSKYRRVGDFVVGVKKQVGNITTNTRDREDAKINNYIILETRIKTFFDMSKAVVELIELIGRNNVLDIHLRDLIYNTKGTILAISSFLGVDAEDKYMQLCVENVYKSTSHSRNLVVWPPELRMMVEHKMKEYKILQGYNFTNG